MGNLKLPARPPDALVFDMDGLLVDTERLARDVWQQSAGDCGFELSDDEYLTLIGLGADEAERTLQERFGTGFDVSVFREHRSRRAQELFASRDIPFKPGARELVAWLAALGIPAGLATSSTRDEVGHRLGRVAAAFATITTRRDVARAKPHPDIYLAAAASLGVEPSACLALEDSFAGVRAASAAGMPVIMVPDLAPPTSDVAALALGVFASLVDVHAALASAWGARHAVR